jgi:hypothetical protein
MSQAEAAYTTARSILPGPNPRAPAVRHRRNCSPGGSRRSTLDTHPPRLIRSFTRSRRAAGSLTAFFAFLAAPPQGLFCGTLAGQPAERPGPRLGPRSPSSRPAERALGLAQRREQRLRFRPLGSPGLSRRTSPVPPRHCAMCASGSTTVNTPSTKRTAIACCCSPLNVRCAALRACPFHGAATDHHGRAHAGTP